MGTFSHIDCKRRSVRSVRSVNGVDMEFCCGLRSTNGQKRGYNVMNMSLRSIECPSCRAGITFDRADPALLIPSPRQARVGFKCPECEAELSVAAALPTDAAPPLDDPVLTNAGYPCGTCGHDMWVDVKALPELMHDFGGGQACVHCDATVAVSWRLVLRDGRLTYTIQ